MKPCIYRNDVDGRCAHSAHFRTGQGAKMFGRAQACVLIGAPENTDNCLDREEPDEKTGISGTIWDLLGDDS